MRNESIAQTPKKTATLLEICAANLNSALIAEAAGADRIELCAALPLGGLTPSAGMILEVVRQFSIPVLPLIRPREGHFFYSKSEVAAMLLDIDFCKKKGCAGVVVGALTEYNQLNINVLREMVAVADGMDVVCHRAFDFTENPAESLEILIELGFTRVLTSGQKSSAFLGRNLIADLIKQAAGRIEIMPGSGVNPENVRQILIETGAKSVHLSAAKPVILNQNLDLPGLESGWMESDAAMIRAVCSAMYPEAPLRT
jgi:copper homeostasis protein